MKNKKSVETKNLELKLKARRHEAITIRRKNMESKPKERRT